MSEKIDIGKLSIAELEALVALKKQQETSDKQRKRDAYEGIRAQVVHDLEVKVRAFIGEVNNFYEKVKNETTAFRHVMEEYGQLRFDNQLSFSLIEENFKIEVKTNRIKGFDERADIAAIRLIDFLRKWIADSEKGINDPMYQLAMTLIERNRYGDLDYKSISKLYDLEEKFDNTEYSEIMNLFKESNVTESTATNFYFSERTELGVWRKLEPNFNRL